ncbi:MAG: hypothetical protein A2161_07895 [Candidatus Schekmanbacteria bacterium RBG_13_48_7]|uniref:Rubrerythrin diiron-binding domain-containing protein n=1 Tax=Candidatus Schekmanbacteria bacterium RBG_13_48_7 TaxID=1817878 RepID=A0A1F7RHR6_9BACT|nr:MAG: hypothetical protein A2161_07895 [Candidatus Schekmanbacteria bacterium RBG_13_48_7]
MTLEEAIKMALDYEKKVRNVYKTAADSASNDTGKKVFNVLAKEEQGHIDYLQTKLNEWKKTGKVIAEKLATVVPSKRVIEDGVKKLDIHLSNAKKGSEREFLSKALQLEIDTSNFYKKMAAELGKDGNLFARFLEIEEGHQAIVQAEMDFNDRTGYLFDFQDFGMV